MNDNELVYALYVQANPVPDPEVLPLTVAEAPLLTLERSADMDTQQRIEIQPTEPVRRRRVLAISFAAVLVVIGAVAIALLITSSDDEPVAAADAAPRITFDGTSCRYNGPTLIEQGTMEVTAVNTTTQRVDVGGFLMLESGLAAELERTPLGTDMALTPTDPMPAGDFYLITAFAGSEGIGYWPITAGTHIIDCVTYPSSGGAPEHVWRAASTIEVVAP